MVTYDQLATSAYNTQPTTELTAGQLLTKYRQLYPQQSNLNNPTLSAKSSGINRKQNTTIKTATPTQQVKDLAAKGYDPNSLAYDQNGKGYSIAPSIVKSNNELVATKGIFYNERGQGFSQNPATVITNIRRDTYSNATLTYANGSKKVVDTGVFQVYNKQYPTNAHMFKAPTTQKTIISGISKGYNDIITGINNAYQSQILAPIISLNSYKPFQTGSANGKILVNQNLGIAGSFIKGVRDPLIYNPAETITIGYTGFGVGKVIGSSKTLLNYATKPAIKYSLLGATVIGTGVNAAKSNNVGYSLGSQAVSLGSFGIGYNAGLTSSIKNFDINKLNFNYKETKVKSLEAVRSVTKSKSFGGNVLDFQNNKPLLSSGVSVTKGGGVYSINNNYYKLTFLEKGFSVDKTSTESVFKSNANIKVTPFKYDFNNVAKQFGNVKTSNLKSISTIKFNNEFINVDTTGRLTTENNIINRVGSFKGKTTNNELILAGRSIDYNNLGKISGSKRDVIGISKQVLSYSKGDTEFNVYNNLNLGRAGKGAVYGLGSSKGSLAGSIGVRSNGGTITVNNIKSFSNVNTLDTSSLVKQSYISDVQVKGLSDISKSKGSTIQLQNPSKTVTPSSDTLSAFNMPKISYSRNTNILKSYSIPKVSQSITPKISYISKSGSNLRQSPIIKQQPIIKHISNIDQSLRQQPITKQQPLLKQSQLLRQSQTLKQSNYFKGYTGFKPLTTTKGGLDLNFNTGGSSKGSFKISKSNSNFKQRYEPSIEAGLFNIRAKKTNLKLSRTGLTLRPILSGGF